MVNLTGKEKFHLDDTLKTLKGPTPEQITFYNQWAATGLDQFHHGSTTQFHFIIDPNTYNITLKWNSDFSKNAMKEKKNIAENGGISLAFFIMNVLFGYKWLIQTEIGEGVDYNFKEEEPTDANFLKGGHNVEISGILSETITNNLKTRLALKHAQIDKGSRRVESSSIIITIFDKATVTKEVHK